MPIELASQSSFQALQKLPFCYLCAKAFEPDADRNGDHVPPSAVFLAGDRDTPLILPTHVGCNSSQSAEDEVIGQLVGVLHGKPFAETGRKPEVITGKFEDGSVGVGVALDLQSIIWRWVRGFHAALYRQPLNDSSHVVFPPMTEGRVVGANVEPVATPDVIPPFVEELKRNRTMRTLDRIVCRNGRCRYECVWTHDDFKKTICVWALDLYEWKELGDVVHFEPRGCIGVYWPEGDCAPADATQATNSELQIQAQHSLDPFAS